LIPFSGVPPPPDAAPFPKNHDPNHFDCDMLRRIFFRFALSIQSMSQLFVSIPEGWMDSPIRCPLRLSSSKWGGGCCRPPVSPSLCPFHPITLMLEPHPQKNIQKICCTQNLMTFFPGPLPCILDDSAPPPPRTSRGAPSSGSCGARAPGTSGASWPTSPLTPQPPTSPPGTGCGSGGGREAVELVQTVVTHQYKYMSQYPSIQVHVIEVSPLPHEAERRITGHPM